MRYLFLLFPLLLLTACDDDDSLQPTIPANETPLEELNRRVPITQEGAGTFGCLINGEVWLPQEGGFGSSPKIASFLMLEEHQISVAARHYYSNLDDGYDNFILIIQDLNLDSTSVYIPSYNPVFNHRFTNSTKYPGEYILDTISENFVAITKLSELTVSGKFTLNLIDTSTYERLIVTEGRFDVNYQEQ